MKYWCDKECSCIVFGEISSMYENPKYCRFKDLTGAEYRKVCTKEIYDSIEDAVNELLKNHV